MSDARLPSLQAGLLGPLVALLVGFSGVFGYLAWSFRAEYAEVSAQIHVNSEVTRDVLEVSQLRARLQEVLLLSRLSGESSRAQIEILGRSRSDYLNRIKQRTRLHPRLSALSASLVGGVEEASYLQNEFAHNLQANDLKRADEALRQLSTIFEINSARLKDLSRLLAAELADDEMALRELVRQIFVLLAASIGLLALTIGLIGIFYRRKLLRPLKTLHGGLQALARGQMHAQVPLTRAPRELFEMMADFNEMVSAIGIARRQLTDAREEALQAARIKSDFLSNMSHEIRTPMNAILGMADLLADTEMPPDKRQYLQVLRNSGRVLLNVVNDILDYSRLESGHFSLEQTPFDLRELAMRVSQVVGVMAAKKSLGFSCRIEPDQACWVSGDAKRVEQIVLNLLGNAVKFTDVGQVSLQIRGRHEGEKVGIELRVADSGIGIPDEHRPRLFTRFTQSDTSITRKYGGTGLGLAIVKQIVDAMDGKIELTSALGLGTEFCVQFALPLAVPPVALPSPMRTGIALRGRVLLVDDAPDNRLLIQAFLKSSPCTVDTATNGLEAVAKFERGAYDLVLMDMQMPVLDGYAATARIRDIEMRTNRRRTPVIALTAFAMQSEVERSLRAGCDVHLSKPVQRIDLLEAMHGALAEPRS